MKPASFVRSSDSGIPINSYPPFYADHVAKLISLSNWEYDSNQRIFTTDDNKFIIMFLDSLRMEHFSFSLVIFSTNKTEIFVVQSPRMNKVKQTLKEVGLNVKHVSSNKAELFADLCTLERNFSLVPKSLVISVLYIKRDQKKKEEWFGNRVDRKFSRFLSMLGDPDVSYDLNQSAESRRTVYKFKWNGLIDVVFHPAPLLNREDQRGLVGNNLSVIVYLQAGAKFEPNFCTSLGIVSQSWCTVQPNAGLYDVEFFTRDFQYRNLIPNLAIAPVDMKTALGLCLERCFNVEKVFREEGPYRHMYEVPRQRAFQTLEEKYKK